MQNKSYLKGFVVITAIGALFLAQNAYAAPKSVGAVSSFLPAKVFQNNAQKNKLPKKNKLSCSDSDGGLNTLTQGWVKLINRTGFVVSSEVDYCVDSNTVREYYCDTSSSNKNFQSFVYADTPCLSGNVCQNGACVKQAVQGQLLITPTAGQSGRVSVGTNNVRVFGFKLTASNEASKVTRLTLTARGNKLSSNDVLNLKLYRNSEIVPFANGSQMSCANNVCTFTWTATDNIFPDVIQPGNPVTVYVMADIGPPGSAQIGDDFSFGVAASSDIVAKGAYSGQTINVTGGVPFSSPSDFYIVPFSVQVLGDAPASGQSIFQTVMTGTQVARFKLVNNGNGQITFTKLNFTEQGYHTGSSTAFRLYYSDQNSTNYVANTAVASQTNTYFNTAITLDGGSYRYVTIAIANIGTSQSGDAFSFKVNALGDIRYSVSEANLGYDNNANGNLNDTVTGLSAEGTPSLGTIVKQ